MQTLKVGYMRPERYDFILFVRISLVLLWLVTGLAVLISPLFLWITLGAILGIVLLGLPSYTWVGTAVLAATVSRLVVATGFAPPIVNFFHFPLTLCAVFVAAIRNTKGFSSLSSLIARGLCGILFVSFLSWIINGGEIMRPFFTWLLFCEPFLLLYALLKNPPNYKVVERFWKLILGIAFLQLPLGLWQAFTFGLKDHVQGTFMKMGAGAHVAGAITIIGTLICISRGLETSSSVRKYSWLILGFVFLIFPVISDAKQAFVAFLPALAFMMVMSARTQQSFKQIVITALVVIIAYILINSFQAFHLITNWDYISRGIWGKIESISIIAQKMSDSFCGWFIGLGPGNSVSRVALLSVGGMVKESSPVSFFNFQISPITLDIIQLSWFSNRLFASSSVWSGVASWFGLFGDFGFVGLGLYLWIVWGLWREFGRVNTWEVLATKATLIMTGILGAMFSWLEEPGFTLLVALMVGLTLVSNKNNSRIVNKKNGLDIQGQSNSSYEL